MIPISTVRLDERAEKLALDVIRSGMIAQGPMVQELENRFAHLVGVTHAIAVNNGTTALVAAMQALEIGPGDEVITSPFTFAASLNAILETGATARFADINDDDYCVNPHEIETRLTEATKAVMPVHLYGQCADMPNIMPLVERHGLALIEDAAQAHGADIEGRKAGSFGIGCFSLYGTKNITTGEGGIITTNDDRLADRLRVLRNQGMRERYQYDMPGHNYRLTDVQAALAIPQLDDYEHTVAARRRNAARLSAGLSEVEGLRVPSARPGRGHVWHQYTPRLTAFAPVDRDELVAKLSEKGVGAGIYYPRLVFDYDCYREHRQVLAEPMPVASALAQQCFSLPVHQHLSESDIDTIIDAVREVMKS
ncbi:MAG: DegT/DnrJ/EryC1/StrS family aminotransferase [Corynebacteriales bacterium]|nr:DegT/DnrJ/EryC1/StrS family aminotransferase [Mycobacteriales bacterium]